ncbi:MAG: helix-turn-helix domain-containing protein [Proteobacteria bacterium]|nr:helix-turn-helix domain-containing protein [Pseudomonadota bacterium]
MKQGDERMMTVQDLMDFLQVSRSSVYRLIERKVFPVYKIEGITRFKRDDILKYIESKKTN